MVEKNVTIVNQDGLHASPATLFVQKAVGFKSYVWLAKEAREVNAKSLLGVLSLGIAKGQNVTIKADGPDEEEAIEALEALILSGFRE